MGKTTSGEKPKFDLITASKTKKYKIITAVFLVIGVLLLGGGLLLRMTVTQAVVPNKLTMDNLSGLRNGVYVITHDQILTLSTGTIQGRALSTPIVFTLADGAETFLEIYDGNNESALEDNQSYYDGIFWLHIRADAPATVTTGTLTITCGSHPALELRFEYHPEAAS